MRRFRARTLRGVDAVVALTERDQATLAALVPSARIERIPLAVDLRPAPLDPVGNGRDVLFVGNFIHPPNVEAAERLVHSIFPRIAAMRPDARLVIVGDKPPASPPVFDLTAQEHTKVLPETRQLLFGTGDRRFLLEGWSIDERDPNSESAIFARRRS